MSIIGGALWLSITFGPVDAGTIDVGGHVVIQAPTFVAGEIGSPRRGHAGFSVPHVIVLPSAVSDETVTGLLEHERIHQRQFDMLGPGLPVAYALTAGRAFEDYLEDEYMYDPGLSSAKRCPLLRFSSGSARLMPCWRFP